LSVAGVSAELTLSLNDILERPYRVSNAVAERLRSWDYAWGLEPTWWTSAPELRAWGGMGSDYFSFIDRDPQGLESREDRWCNAQALVDHLLDLCARQGISVNTPPRLPQPRAVESTELRVLEAAYDERKLWTDVLREPVHTSGLAAPLYHASMCFRIPYESRGYAQVFQWGQKPGLRWVLEAASHQELVLTMQSGSRAQIQEFASEAFSARSRDFVGLKALGLLNADIEVPEPQKMILARSAALIPGIFQLGRSLGRLDPLLNGEFNDSAEQAMRLSKRIQTLLRNKNPEALVLGATQAWNWHSQSRFQRLFTKQKLWKEAFFAATNRTWVGQVTGLLPRPVRRFVDCPL
jgi:hypothetical protein